MTTHLIGVDLGGTNIKAGVVDAEGKVLSRVRAETQADRGPKVVAERIASLAREAAKAAGIAPTDAIGVGVGSPGTLDLEHGIVTFSPNMRGMDGFPLRDAVSKGLGGLPVALENDANAAARGEQWTGAGRGAHSMVMLTLGTGIGSGVVIEGRVWHGATGVGSELGHMTIDMNGPRCGCGNTGCIEALASATAMVRRMKETIAAGVPTVLAAAPDQITAKRIYEAAVAGDAPALENIRMTGVYLGVAVSNILHAYNPEVVVLSGGVIGAGAMLMDPLRAEVDKRTMLACREGATIRFAELGEDAGFIGAAGCALNRFGRP